MPPVVAVMVFWGTGHFELIVVLCRAITDHGQTSTWTLSRQMGMLRC